MPNEMHSSAFRIAGKVLKCRHCQGDCFDSRIFYLEPNLWFFRDMPTSQVAIRVFACVVCGCLEQFVGDKKIEAINTAEDNRAQSSRDCPSCGLSLDESLSTCPGCMAKLK